MKLSFADSCGCFHSTSYFSRRYSPSDQAWKGQPRGVKGGSASVISEMCPRPAVLKMGFQRRQEFFAGLLFDFGSAAADADPGFDEGADEPGPDGALMVGAVALVQRADVVRHVAGRAGGQRAQAQRREQVRFDGIDDSGALVRH